MYPVNSKRCPARLILIFAGAVTLAGAGSAAAHVVMVPDTAAPGAPYVGVFRVSHGCAGSATTALRVELPPGVIGAKPQAKAGWTVEIEREPLARPVMGEGGKPITTRVKAITWRGHLPDDQFDTFGVMMKLPESRGPLYLPAIQSCEVGANRWTDIPAPGQAWHGVPSPAPVITLGDGDGAAAGPSGPPDGLRMAGGALATAAGQPLYTFDWDTMKGMSHCVGECLMTRRPLIVKPGARPYGDWSIIGRKDGALQWAYRDKPLYTFRGDAPGQPPKGEEEGTWTLAK